MPHPATAIARAIDQALGREPADLVIRDVRLFDLVTGTFATTDIAVCGHKIVATHGNFEGVRIVDGRGRIAAPGFVDTHLHVESSLVTPFEFDRMVLPHGVTTAIWDPHEIANVLGIAGLRYALDCSARCVVDLRVMLSSCVPATSMETSGARIEAEDLLSLIGHRGVLGLAEFMNVPGLLSKEPSALAKLAAFRERHVDGHAPLVRGRELNAILAAGIRTDHETTSAAEGREKLSKGMHLLIREGSVSKDLHALAELLTVETSPFCALCTDDRNPLDVAEEGHLDHMVRTLIGLGAPPLAVYRAASWSGANAFGLKDRGLLAPGRRADIVLLDSLEECRVSDVICAGRLVEPSLFEARETLPPVGMGSMRAEPVTPAAFSASGGPENVPVIGVVPGRIITEHLRLSLPVSGGERRIDLRQDAIKVAVVERHGVNGNVSVGFVRGFGLREGAIASSVAHDSHNICVVGADEAAMAAAVDRLIAIGGGLAVARGPGILAELALPLAGLMSLEPFEVVRGALVQLRAAAREIGCKLHEPFLQVSFLALPVIPHLKITDRGMVDVDRFAFTS